MPTPREHKAAKIMAVLYNFLGEGLRHLRCLDVGCGNGTMLKEFGAHFRFAVGIDPAQPQNALPSTLQVCSRGENIPFPDAHFDVVICAQVYEHVQDPYQLADEIRRVLKPGGAIFFSGPNRFALIEEHYHLPLLSWLRPRIADAYMRLTHRGRQYDIRPLSYGQLRRLWRGFKIHDYTPQLLFHHAHYHVTKRVRVRIPLWLGKMLRPLVPNFNWVLTAVSDLPSNVYTQKYYLTECDGYQQFAHSQGENLPRRLTYPLEMANIQPGQRVLDLGCGRGELALHCARRGAQVWGLDYAPEALKLARQLPLTQNLAFQQADAQKLPFPAAQFDVIFMLDVVEHLTPHQLNRTLQEVNRTLQPGGRLIIHTMPNTRYYRWGYPLYRLVQGLRGQKIPKDPRTRWEHAHLHVNEQNPLQLQRTLTHNGFKPRVWLANVQNFEYEPNPWIRAIQYWLTRLPIAKAVFCNDIFAVAKKTK
ncbi:MAG: methyltransferase domain-containing protein [Anaerolineae bacterium]|nr:methyltransferase domain-containing protein [Anaerolineae bacterium]